MSDIKVTTNNRVRPLLSVSELPESARSEFDYIGEDEFDSPRIFKFRDSYWDAFEFDALRNEIANGAANDGAFKGWDGAYGTSYFDAVLIRLRQDDYGDDGVIVGHASW